MSFKINLLRLLHHCDRFYPPRGLLMTLIKKLGFFLNPFLAGLRGVPKSLQVDGIWYFGDYL